MTISLPEWLPTPSQHLLIAAVALLVYLVNARARRERRAPAAAIGWVMGLALAPYVVLPLYLAFGQRKLPVPFRWQHPQTDVQSAEPMRWASAMLASFGLAHAAPARVRFHADGAAARSALWDLIENARHELDVCTFLIGDDDFGRAVLQQLSVAARAGVRVRLLHDGLGAWSAPRTELRTLTQAGGQVRVFRTPYSWRRSGPRNLRNHRKFVVADGSRLWAGGRNLATEYFTGTSTTAPWIDLTFDLEGATAAHAARQFEQDWHCATHAGWSDVPPATPPAAHESVQGSLAQFLPSGPDQGEDTAHSLLVAAAFRAEKRVLAITPYFVPDAALLDALRLAARRGVEITLVMPARSNHRLADFARGRPLRELTQAGARVLLLPQMSHAKAVVFDDTLALCGSINLDSRSLLLNYECAVVFHGEREITWLAEWILLRAAEGRPFEAAEPGLLRDLAEGALLAVAFQI